MNANRCTFFPCGLCKRQAQAQRDRARALIPCRLRMVIDHLDSGDTATQRPQVNSSDAALVAAFTSSSDKPKAEAPHDQEGGELKRREKRREGAIRGPEVNLLSFAGVRPRARSTSLSLSLSTEVFMEKGLVLWSSGPGGGGSPVPGPQARPELGGPLHRGELGVPGLLYERKGGGDNSDFTFV